MELATTMIKANSDARNSSGSQSERGFTLIEVMIAIALLMIGLLSMLAVFGVAMASTQTAQSDMIAKQIAQEAMESIFTARDTSAISFAQIQNIPSGIFNTGFTQILAAGPDGLEGTADDVAGNVVNPKCPGPSRCLILPGPDGILGTADDVYLPLNNFTRQIAITPLTDAFGNTYGNLRLVTITVNYTAGRFNKTYTMSEYISQYR
jgi:prepilin-type N-terminal cleavage/methylation domain-containing protein